MRGFNLVEGDHFNGRVVKATNFHLPYLSVGGSARRPSTHRHLGSGRLDNRHLEPYLAFVGVVHVVDYSAIEPTVLPPLYVIAFVFDEFIA
jgi:hypothetical protein